MMRRMMIGWSFAALALLLTSKAIAEDRPVEPPGLSVREGQLVLAGRPYRGVGANYFDLFLRILHEPTNSTSLRGLEELCRAGSPFVRFATAFREREAQKAVTAWTTNRLEWLRWLKGIAREQQGPLWVGEFGLPSGTNLDLRADFDQLLTDLEAAKVDLAAFWVFDLDGQKNTWSVTPTNDRAFMLRGAAEANRRWNRALAGANRGIPDNRDTASMGLQPQSP